MKHRKPIAVALIAVMLGFSGCASQPVHDSTVRGTVRNSMVRNARTARNTAHNRLGTEHNRVPRYSTNRDGVSRAVGNAVHSPARPANVRRAVNHAVDQTQRYAVERPIINHVDLVNNENRLHDTAGVNTSKVAPKVDYRRSAGQRANHAPIAAPRVSTKAAVPTAPVRQLASAAQRPTAKRASVSKQTSVQKQAKQAVKSSGTAKTDSSRSQNKVASVSNETPKHAPQQIAHVAPRYNASGQRIYGGVPTRRNRPQNVQHANEAKMRKAALVSRHNPDGTINNRITSQIKGTGKVYRAGYPISLRDELYGITRNPDGTVNLNNSPKAQAATGNNPTNTPIKAAKGISGSTNTTNNFTSNTVWQGATGQSTNNTLLSGGGYSFNNLAHKTIV